MNTNYKKCMKISNQTVFSDLLVTISGCLSPQQKHNAQQNTIKIQRTIKAIIVSKSIIIEYYNWIIIFEYYPPTNTKINPK